MSAEREGSELPAAGTGSALPRANAPEVSSTCWTAQRRDILQWLARSFPPLAELYRTTVMLYFEIEVPSRGCMVAHGVREICSRLPWYFVEVSTGRVTYADMTEELLIEWRKANLRVGALPFPAGGDASVQREPQAVPAEIVDQVAKLLASHEKGRSNMRDRVTAMFITLQKSEGALEGQVMPTVRHWMYVYNWFVGRAHLEAENSAIMTDEFKANFELFERLLHTLVGGFFDVVEDIDAILAETNA